MTLDEFVQDMQNDIISFQSMWVIEHKKNPDIYPLEFDKDNDGMWYEQFKAYCEMNGRS